MIGDLGIVNKAAAERTFAGAGGELIGVGAGHFPDDAGERGSNVGGDVATIGTRIADQLVAFIEGLSDVERFLGTEAEEAARGFAATH